MFSFLCILTSIIVGLCLFFVFFGHTMFYHALVSFKKREMLTIREHLCSPSAFLMGFMWLIFLVFWAVVFLLVFVLYRVSNVAGGTGLSMLPVSLNCQCCLCHWIVNFSIASSVFFNIYWYRLSFSYLLVRIPFMTRCTRYNIM
jgi:hypothetical protein